MFKNKAIQVKVVPANQNESSSNEITRAYNDPEQMNRIAKDFVKHTVIVIGVAFAAGVVLNTTAEIVKKAAEHKLQ